MNATTVHDRLQDELPFFSRHTLQIKDKDGVLRPFIFNTAQEYLHDCIEDQLKTQGRVRVLILKGRQQGCSTYTSARFYHKATRNHGKSVFILSHEAQTTDKLFTMVDRFQSNMPIPLKPSTDLYNRRQIQFDVLNSEYTVGTAGNEDVGRGGTLQYFHGSEVAFWEKTDGIQTGILQSIADVDNTEIILESTANGMGNMFHRMCMSALAGKGDYKLIFIPWFWQPEYRRKLEDGFVIEEDEQVLKEQFGWDDEQVFWRRMKIENLGSLWKFRQEYPNTIQDAFVTSGTPLILADDIIAARKSDIKDPDAPLILGVDPARVNDRCVIARRRGRELLPMVFITPSGDGVIRQTAVATRLARIIDNDNVAKCFIDVGHGYGIIDILVGWGYGDIVQGVHFNEKPADRNIFSNKRAEMHIALRDWLHEGGVSIPDEEDVHVDFSAIPDYEETPTGLIKIVAKDKIKEVYGKSPDITDATNLTFAYPVRRDIMSRRGGKRIRKAVAKGKSQSPLKTLNRFRKKVSGRREGVIHMNFRDIHYGEQLGGS